MQIIPSDTVGSHRTGRLENITTGEVNGILGFGPNVDDDPDKVVNSWGFKAMGQNCAIWDYKGSHKYKQFSTYGSHEIFSMLFGNRYVVQ